jgi:hypothetical protein
MELSRQTFIFNDKVATLKGSILKLQHSNIPEFQYSSIPKFHLSIIPSEQSFLPNFRPDHPASMDSSDRSNKSGIFQLDWNGK